MKRITLIILVLFCYCDLCSQDTLSIENLKPLTHVFEIENGKLMGDGADFLRKEMSEAQFTMLGEYHGSKRISVFTKSIIPHLDSLGYKTFVLEVGPVSGKVLNQEFENVHEYLRKLNGKYLVESKNGYQYTPIPFFSNVEDADFLELAKSKNWNILGIDQEFRFGYQMLLDMMFDNLIKEQKEQNRELYEQATHTLQAYIKKDLNGERGFHINIKSSSTINEFCLKVASEAKNIELIEAFEESNHIYWLNDTNQWFENNETRVKYMKEQLRKQLSESNFDLNEDKLLIKMGGVHVSKGFSPLRLYEVGNTLNEMAAFNGKKALNITFSNRFYMESGEVIDILESSNKYDQEYKSLNQMGMRDKWIVVDLRPLIKGHYYYPRKYDYNDEIKDLVKRYDLLIIPPIEMDPTPNYIKE